jgi:pyrophosphatase PpaX
MFNFKCILFDLDGTLIDTTPLIMESFKHTFKQHNNEEVPDEEILSFIGLPLRKPFECLCPGREDVMLNTYREYNENRHDCCVGVFIDIINVLEELKERGTLLGVVTSKRQSLAMRGLRLFGLDKYMSVFVALEDTEKHKPGGEPILEALSRLNIKDKSSVLYVGDSSHDILCAKNAGVRSAAVRWSYMPEQELTILEPDLFIRSPKDLLKYV